MPTIRSQWSFKQVERALHKLAHKIAIEAVEKLEDTTIRVVAYGKQRLSHVETDQCEIRFFAKHVSYTLKGSSGNWREWWSFDLEQKIYLSSPHRSKISIGREENRKKVLVFIEELMKKAGETINPRFSLRQHIREVN